MASLHLVVMDTCDVANGALYCWDQSWAELVVNRETISKKQHTTMIYRLANMYQLT